MNRKLGELLQAIQCTIPVRLATRGCCDRGFSSVCSRRGRNAPVSYSLACASLPISPAAASSEPWRLAEKERFREKACVDARMHERVDGLMRARADALVDEVGLSCGCVRTHTSMYICLYHGNWLVTIGRSPLLAIIRLLSDINHMISISYSWGALHMVT